MSAFDKQVNGNHYKGLAIQPIHYCHANKLGPCESNIVKYATRWQSKGKIDDLRKIIHYAELLIEMEAHNDYITPTPFVRAEATPEEWDALK